MDATDRKRLMLSDSKRPTNRVLRPFGLIGQMGQRVLMAVAILVLVISLGLLVGNQAAYFMKDQQKLKARSKRTSAILDQMNTIEVGDTLPDYRLETLDGDFVWISDLLTDKTLVSFYHPACYDCTSEIELLSNTCSDLFAYRHFLFISSTDPATLRKHRDSLGFPVQFLHDKDREYANHLHVVNYPFNVIVDRAGRIKEIINGTLYEREIQSIIESNQTSKRDLKQFERRGYESTI